MNRVPLNLLRSSIAMVPQDSFLFSTTIAENVRFGCPDADREEVREAARRAHVLHDVEDFPTASTRSSASAASRSRAVSGRGSRWRARWRSSPRS